jgi:hypothetical protein
MRSRRFSNGLLPFALQHLTPFLNYSDCGKPQEDSVAGSVLDEMSTQFQREGFGSAVNRRFPVQPF